MTRAAWLLLTALMWAAGWARIQGRRNRRALWFWAAAGAFLAVLAVSARWYLREAGGGTMNVLGI